MITDRKEIEERLPQQNIKHFGQANQTLFASPEYQQTFGYTGVGPETDKLLQGDWDKSINTAETPEGKRILKHLSSGQLPKTNEAIGFEDFKQPYGNGGGTSMSPSGRHLGHYKCPFLDDENGKYMDNNQDPKAKY
jgi:hypothetical protein